MCEKLHIDAVVICVEEASFPGCIDNFVSNCAHVCAEWGEKGYTTLNDSLSRKYYLLLHSDDVCKIGILQLEHGGDMNLVSIFNPASQSYIYEIHEDVIEDALNANDIALYVNAVGIVGA